MPTLVESQNLNSGTSNTNVLTTTSFTPANGQVLVAKVTTWDRNVPAGVVTGGNQVWTKVKEAQPAGFYAYSAIYTCTVDTSLIGGGGSMTVSCAAPASAVRHGMQYERWGSAVLAATPATNATVNGNTGGAAATSAITTTGNNSIISAVLVDNLSLNPSGHTYTNGTEVEEAVWDGSVGSNTVHYWWYWNAGTAGAKTIGIATPTGMAWAMCAVEIKHAATNISDTADAASPLAVSHRVTSTRALSTSEKPGAVTIGSTHATSVRAASTSAEAALATAGSTHAQSAKAIATNGDAGSAGAWSTRAQSLKALSQSARPLGSFVGSVNATSTLEVPETFTYLPGFAIAPAGVARSLIGTDATADVTVDIGTPVVQIDIAGPTVTVDLRS